MGMFVVGVSSYWHGRVLKVEWRSTGKTLDSPVGEGRGSSELLLLVVVCCRIVESSLGSRFCGITTSDLSRDILNNQFVFKQPIKRLCYSAINFQQTKYGFPLSTKKCFLAFLAVSLAMLCFLVHFPKNSYQPSLQRIKPPVPEAIQIKDPIFKKSCYSYSNIVATNKCCKMLEYDFPLLEKCLKTFNATRNIPKPSNNTQNLNSTSKEIIHIILVGDSHMRYLFSAVSLRLASPDLRYRKKANKKWSYGTTALKKMRNQHLVTTLETKHLTLPIRVTYHTEFFLEGLPHIMDRWEKGRETKPTVVIMDSGLHFMTKRPDLKAIPYEKSLIQLKPYFTRLAATVPVYYKLTDDLQAARHRTHKMSLNLTKLYNDIAVRELHGTGVTLWDSTIPLSAQYNDACAKKNRNTPPLFKWKCSDARHLGYIVVDQFANMVYNAVCNKYLDLDQDHCGLEERRVMDGL